MTIRTLLNASLLHPLACILVLVAPAACDKKDEAAPAAAPSKSAEPVAETAKAAESAAKPGKPAVAPAAGVKIVANFEEFNGNYDKFVALVNDAGVEIHLARDCPALTCATFTEDGYSRSDELLLAACPKVFLAEVGFDDAKDLPVGEHKATIGLLGLAESETNSMVSGNGGDLATVTITERTPQAFVGTITYGEEDGSNAAGSFSAPICPHKD